MASGYRAITSWLSKSTREMEVVIGVRAAGFILIELALTSIGDEGESGGGGGELIDRSSI